MIEGFLEFVPPAPLDRYIQRLAYAYFPKPLPPEQLAPDSYIKWSLIMDGDPKYFDHDGPMDWHEGFSGHVPPERGIIGTSAGPVRFAMVNFYPSAFHQLFGRRSGEFNGRMTPSREVIGDGIASIYARMRSARDPQAMFDLLLEYVNGLHERLGPNVPSDMEVLERRIRGSKGSLSVKEMARSVGLSERQLQRRFKDAVGLSPKEFCSIVRFNHVYNQMQRTHNLDLDIALQCGYFDESHMLKDLTYYLGKVPKRFAQMIRPMVDINIGR